MATRPSDSCECWQQAKLEQDIEPHEEEVSVTIRGWNPRSKRYEDVKAE